MNGNGIGEYFREQKARAEKVWLDDRLGGSGWKWTSYYTHFVERNTYTLEMAGTKCLKLGTKSQIDKWKK